MKKKIAPRYLLVGIFFLLGTPGHASTTHPLFEKTGFVKKVVTVLCLIAGLKPIPLAPARPEQARPTPILTHNEADTFSEERPTLKEPAERGGQFFYSQFFGLDEPLKSRVANASRR